MQLGIIDRIIPEPLGGAHRKPDEIIAHVGDALALALAEVSKLDKKSLVAARHEKFLSMGQKSLS